MAGKRINTINDLVNVIRVYEPKADLTPVLKAHKYAKKAHVNQVRLQGYDYVHHLIESAIILAGMHLDIEAICAALLHDTVEDTNVTIDDIKKEFGEGVAQLVEPLTKIEKVRFTSIEDYTAENLRKVLFATSKDVRVMMIKLADRLDNMRSLDVFEEPKRKRIAKETLDIYAPIAEKLGIWRMKGELEDLALRYLDPQIYNMLKETINEKREEREEYTKKTLDSIKHKLDQINIDAKIYGRAKYFYSIYKKMKKKGKTIKQIHDLIAIRIITNTVAECYAALILIQKIYKPIPGRLKDYIKNPKKNGYQSIHIDVGAPENKVLEIQIRTMGMHHQAEQGVAAHWKYKETERDKEFDRKISWLKQILDWKRDAKGNEFVNNLRIELFQDEIVTLTPKSDPIILPEGATPIDFGYAVHTGIGNTCSKAEVNGNIVPLMYKLKSGDVVKIITQKNANPSRNWLNFVKTSKAKSKIRSFLNIQIDNDAKYIRSLETQEVNLLNYIIYNGKRPVKLSKCCNPQYLDAIIGFYTKDNTLTIHKKSCSNILNLDQRREEKDIAWKKEDPTIKNIVVTVKDRIGLIPDVLDSALQMNIPVLSINIKTRKENVKLNLKIKAESIQKIAEFHDQLHRVDGVIESEVLERKTFPFFGVFK